MRHYNYKIISQKFDPTIYTVIIFTFFGMAVHCFTHQILDFMFVVVLFEQHLNVSFFLYSYMVEHYLYNVVRILLSYIIIYVGFKIFQCLDTSRLRFPIVKILTFQ